MDRSNEDIRTSDDDDVAHGVGCPTLVQSESVAGHSSPSTGAHLAGPVGNVLSGPHGRNVGYVFDHGISRIHAEMGRIGVGRRRNG